MAGRPAACKAKKLLTMKVKQKLMFIGQTARQAGISTQSLQYYIMVGLIKPTSVSKTNRRLFDGRAVDRIKLIKKLNKSGYPLRAIRELFLEGRPA
jgi:DNA-binding transcriptional MerR regulator